MRGIIQDKVPNGPYFDTDVIWGYMIINRTKNTSISRYQYNLREGGREHDALLAR